MPALKPSAVKSSSKPQNSQFNESGNSPPVADPLLFTLPQAANFAGLTVWQIRGLISSHELKFVPVGRKFYIRKATLLKWAERAETAA